MQSLVLTIRCWYVYGRSWIIGSMSAESPPMGIWNNCKVRTETLRDTLSSGTNLSSMSVMVTDLQTHETPDGLLTCPVLLYFHVLGLFFFNVSFFAFYGGCEDRFRRFTKSGYNE